MDWAILTELGSSGLLTVVVVLFLRHLKDRDTEFIQVLRENTQALKELVKSTKE